nr:hypothetical protein [Salinispora tropica]
MCGPNGAGKSTLLRVLASDLAPRWRPTDPSWPASRMGGPGSVEEQIQPARAHPSPLAWPGRGVGGGPRGGPGHRGGVSHDRRLRRRWSGETRELA